ncbi:MAG TPA: non-ribosomal peptide synthetase [Steroidobacteraceae bacterium]|nr:non-ribosomal peptide synthetase [Steroidobacteraceae bacterium]
MLKAITLNDLLDARHPADRGITYFEGENDSRRVSFVELRQRALGILHHLQRLGARRGDRMILFLANNEQFIDGFWACLLGGIVPIPLAIGISDAHRDKFLRIARKLGAPFVYTDRKSMERINTYAAREGAAELAKSLHPRTFLVDNLDDISREGKPAKVTPEDIAFVQFSSGSTSEPKGVVLTHGNIIANARGTTDAALLNERDVSFSWMPLTHDMGLIGFHLFMIANSMQTNLMTTDLFVRRPLLWLKLASQVRATVLCSPNFGYKHYLKVLADRPVEDLDLSAVRLIFNGAEPISAPLCREFTTRLALARLNPNAMFPVYGLAEASLAVAFPPVGSPLTTITLDRHQLGVAKPVVPLDAGHGDAIELVSEGAAIPHCRVRVTDDDDKPLPENQVGHVHITGENVTRGYYENAEANAAGFTADGWLRTGDLGLFRSGQLFISGRAKEIIFVNGQNYYPHDIEAIALRGEGMELGKVAATAVRPAGAQVEQLFLFVIHRGSMTDFLPLAHRLSRLVNEQTGIEVAAVVPVKRIPKTTSGKMQRHVLQESYLDGEFEAELKELDNLRAAQGSTTSSPLSAIEEKLRGICDAALEGKRVDVHDNLFDIGASSLKLIEIHEQIDREFPGKIDLTELFDFPTIAELAKHLEAKLAGPG